MTTSINIQGCYNHDFVIYILLYTKCGHHLFK